MLVSKIIVQGGMMSMDVNLPTTNRPGHREVSHNSEKTQGSFCEPQCPSGPSCPSSHLSFFAKIVNLTLSSLQTFLFNFCPEDVRLEPLTLLSCYPLGHGSLRVKPLFVKPTTNGSPLSKQEKTENFC